ncbi:hypothetical protein BH11ARM2_BH11ARM2_36100 [soil metagenome]
MKKGIGLAALLLATMARASFTDDERRDVARFWNEPGRYASESSRWQARLTPEGSQWLWNLNKLRNPGKTAPNTTPSTGHAAWDEWLASKYEADRLVAEAEVSRLNGQPPILPPSAFSDPEPFDLNAAAGPAPVFVAAVQPKIYHVRFDEGEYQYTDQVNVRQKYAYFRFAQGVMAGGRPVKSLPSEELDALLADSGVDATQGRVMRAVSMLEGGFESVNTYDTGFLSVGFIQFAALMQGGGSLGAVMLRLKSDEPTAFQNDFRRYGIDVSDAGLIQVADESGDLEGASAVARIIDDKRLTAVFQRAGERCRAFRIAQIRTAMSSFYPSNDPVTLVCSRGTLAGKVSDFIKSEAGLATLMDRKVNTGNIAALAAAAKAVAEQVGATCLSDLVPYERDIVAKLRYRKDYLSDTTLAQPAGGVTLASTPPLTSRSGSGRGNRNHNRKSRS